MRILLTYHAQMKSKQRTIPQECIQKVIENPEKKEIDRFDSSLIHFISQVENRYLRIIGRWLNKSDFLVVSVFFDRRLKKKGKKKC